MKYTKEDKNLIANLRMISLPSDHKDDFKEKLSQSINSQYPTAWPGKSFNLNFIFFIMNKEVLFIFIALLVLAVFAVGGYTIYTNSNKYTGITGVTGTTNRYEVTEQIPESDNSLSTSLPTNEFDSLSDAQKDLSYTIKVPTVKVGSEGIAKIRTSIKNEFDDGQNLFVTYAQNGKPMYEISYAIQTFGYPGDVEKIQSGSITYSYSAIESFEENQNENSVSLGDIYSARSYIFWKDGEVSYQISEFGKVSKEELIKLADSMKAIK